MAEWLVDVMLWRIGAARALGALVGFVSACYFRERSSDLLPSARLSLINLSIYGKSPTERIQSGSSTLIFCTGGRSQRNLKVSFETLLPRHLET